MRELDFSGRAQLYYQLYDLLHSKITTKVYPIGSKLPAESELMDMYHVSRATVRKAMEMLSNDGLIEKRQGHGTYVVDTLMKNSLKRVVRYDKKNESNATAVKKMISIQEVKASKEIATALHIEEETILIRIQRMRYANKEPMYMEINYFEKAWAPSLLERDFSKESLRLYLADTYRVRWSHAIQQIYAIQAGSLAPYFAIDKRNPLLFIKRISYDASDVPREYVETYYVHDNYHLEMELSI